MGICGFGGFALNAAAMDTRIKATVAVTMYDMTRVSAKGYNDSVDADARHEMKVALNKQRTLDYAGKTFKTADVCQRLCPEMNRSSLRITGNTTRPNADFTHAL